MVAPSDYSIVYVITSDGKDVFADMGLVSMLSVRASNPGRRLVAVCDAESAAALQREGHRLVQACDELISVETPAGKPTFRNRWIKTQLPRFIEGNFLFLDSDILVRKSLDFEAYASADIAAVPNHSSEPGEPSIPPREEETINLMRWERPGRIYVNGGVLWCGTGPATKRFFEYWHQFWSSSVSATGLFFDQPALNVALERSGATFAFLPAGYNAQVLARPCSAQDAALWHFYHSDGLDVPRTVLHELLQRAGEQDGPKPDLVRSLCAKPLPWFADGLIARCALRSMLARRGLLGARNWDRLWLAGCRMSALQELWREAMAYVRTRVRIRSRVPLRSCRQQCEQLNEAKGSGVADETPLN